MSSNAITIPGTQIEARPWVDELHQWLTTVDHKRLGILYIVSALLFLAVGGVEALIIRIQLMHSHNNFVSPEVFNQMFTMHGTTMIFFVAMPILFGFANYLVPLMIGARDMAFPRLNAFSFWLSFLGGLLLYFSFFGGSGLYGAGNAPDVGWWSYAPLGRRAFSPGHSSDYWTLALLRLRVWKHRNGDQYHCDHSLPAMPGYEAQSHAAAGVAQPGDGGNGSDCDYPAYRPRKSCC